MCCRGAWPVPFADGCCAAWQAQRTNTLTDNICQEACCHSLTLWCKQELHHDILHVSSMGDHQHDGSLTACGTKCVFLRHPSHMQHAQVLQKGLREAPSRVTTQPNLRKRDFESELLDRLLNDTNPPPGAPPANGSCSSTALLHMDWPSLTNAYPGAFINLILPLMPQHSTITLLLSTSCLLPGWFDLRPCPL